MTEQYQLKQGSDHVEIRYNTHDEKTHALLAETVFHAESLEDLIGKLVMAHKRCIAYAARMKRIADQQIQKDGVLTLATGLEDK